ncbi:MAG: LytTR family DNA-binding domain-containing protein [Flavobacteriales bacterium]|nr:LytTR family DNA-binding domain-containing protein [Flavobacteriales bacterium]
MNRLKCVLVDDEPDAIETLSIQLSHVDKDIEIIGTFNDISSAFKGISELQPDLVFLDIELGSETSFELIELFDEINFKIIFVTGHNAFAIKAIKFSALDYLLKPVRSVELIEAISKAKKTIFNKESYDLLKDQIRQQKLSPKIAINTGDEVVLLNIKDILRCEADKNYTWIYTNTKKYLISKPLKEYDFLLNEHGFYRSHKSHLISLDQITSFTHKDGGYIVMKDDSEVPIAQRKKADFLEMMNRLFKYK